MSNLKTNLICKNESQHSCVGNPRHPTLQGQPMARSGRSLSLQWRYIEREGVPNHRRPYCLLNRLFRRRSRKASTLRVTGLCDGNPPMTGGFPHKGPVTRKMFPFDDVIMRSSLLGNANLIQKSSNHYSRKGVSRWRIVTVSGLRLAA